MTDTTYQNGGSQRVVRGMLVAGGLIGAWAFTALMFALSKFDWQVGELFRQPTTYLKHPIFFHQGHQQFPPW